MSISIQDGSIVSITPIHQSSFILNYVGVEVFIKREDQQDKIGSGAKIRQINSLLNTAEKTHRSPIIIDGIPQSNCLMSICHYAEKRGIPLHLLLKGNKPKEISGNYRSIKRSTASITWVPRIDQLDRIRTRLEKFYRRKTHNPISVPAGANSNLTVIGPLDLGMEIARQEEELAVKFSHIVLPVGTGCTLNGLEISKAYHRRNWKVIGVRIDEFDYSFYCKNYNE